MKDKKFLLFSKLFLLFLINIFLFFAAYLKYLFSNNKQKQKKGFTTLDWGTF